MIRLGATRTPFKVRILRLNTPEVLQTLVEQEKVELELIQVPSGPNKGKTAARVSLKKPKAWWRMGL